MGSERTESPGERLGPPPLPQHSYWFDLWLFVGFDAALFLLMYFVTHHQRPPAVCRPTTRDPQLCADPPPETPNGVISDYRKSCGRFVHRRFVN
ncbi:LOW QUALITY PROTEIN: hypothetical protein CRUP_025342 [Coryphaenoides rupestris]|nr:LOW QUALITY PROTEIN: hypothetical protein CRUP_025342 [Coryphaenoides rupestris]